jgi:hypothetical protein
MSNSIYNVNKSRNELHREDGPAIENDNGDKWYYINGKRHRKDGAAVELSNGDKYWYIKGMLHRLDGPAIEYGNGIKYWFIDGEQICCKDNEEFLRIIKLKSFL